MKLLIFQNYPCEDAALAGAAFEEYGMDIEVIDCYHSKRPPDAEGDALLVLGGPMNVYEEGKYAFLKWETEWIRDWAEDGRPMLGLCLGAQLLSKAAGGKVTQNPAREIGHFEVCLTKAGLEDPLFMGIRNPIPVVQWHQDTFSIPPGGILLATSETCKNQAFRIYRAIGLQFHLEINREKMAAWIHEYVNDSDKQGIDTTGILDDFAGKEIIYDNVCRTMIRNFIRYEVTSSTKSTPPFAASIPMSGFMD